MVFNLFSKKQSKANNRFLANQRGQQAIARIQKLNLPAELKQQLIDADVFDIWFSDKDLAPLAEIMQKHDDEKIVYAAIGINVKSKNVMLVCTNQRLIILSKKMLSKEQALVIPLKQIKSVVLHNSIVYDELTLINGDEILRINAINKVAAPILAKNIKKYSKLAQNDSSALDEQVEQVKKLKELLDQGILTKAEFEAKKKQILGL
ncbi:PH domain-containing protein [Lactobacillus amylolyticus]|uniref:PH domain-containing protein n=1 Tax=Lactobacillus amylolyticus TaxID=83683 RepID=UPI000FC998A7|nr:PH domain-containing protein [Lactobacillus amylolyticus]